MDKVKKGAVITGLHKIQYKEGDKVEPSNFSKGHFDQLKSKGFIVSSEEKKATKSVEKKE